MRHVRHSLGPADRKEGDLVARIEWNKDGERFFETGISQGVLYPLVSAGVPWNGIVSVTESSEGGEITPLYFEGVKYQDIVASEDFEATIDAYSSPAKFAEFDGYKILAKGLFAAQQIRKTFGLAYKTLKGNDLVASEYGYKLHIVYNCTAAPASRSYQTIGRDVSPSPRSWSVHTVPPVSSTFKPTAHIVVDSNLSDPTRLAQLEAVLYGDSGTSARQPTIAEVVDILTA